MIGRRNTAQIAPTNEALWVSWPCFRKKSNYVMIGEPPPGMAGIHHDESGEAGIVLLQ